MQLISVGDVLLNLDQITVMDMDRTANGAVLRIHRDSSEPIIEINIPLNTVKRLYDLVPQNLRMIGEDV
jgi:hypothetical protein